MVFGETKRANTRNIGARTFHLGDKLIEEVTHYDHLGITLCSYGSPSERTKSACNKGSRAIANLKPAGVRSVGLYPFVCSFLWNIVCIPSMLHGCELWNNLCQIELDMLETTQCRVLRMVQGLAPRTHNVITRGLVGELSVKSCINQATFYCCQ